MFGQEKFVQQPVHLQQPVAVQHHRAVLDLPKTPVLQNAERLRKTLADIDAEFCLKIIATRAAQLELQNELADQPLIGARRHGPVNGQPARVDRVDVRLEIVLVLIMRPLQVPERGHAQPD